MSFSTGIQKDGGIKVNEVGEHDQWMLMGDCKQCRRGSYCTKPCKAHKRHLQRLLIEGLRKKTSIDVIQDVVKQAYGE